MIGLDEYADAERLMAGHELRKREAAKPPYVEVVLLSARSRSDLERTHSRYFKTARELAENP